MATCRLSWEQINLSGSCVPLKGTDKSSIAEVMGLNPVEAIPEIFRCL